MKSAIAWTAEKLTAEEAIAKLEEAKAPARTRVSGLGRMLQALGPGEALLLKPPALVLGEDAWTHWVRARQAAVSTQARLIGGGFAVRTRQVVEGLLCVRMQDDVPPAAE